MVTIFDWEEIIKEGSAEIIIPLRELFKRENGYYEPAWSPVFYNPLMRISRDLTVLFTYYVFNGKQFYFIDVLSGTGIRGIRLALESNGYGIINDIDPIAYHYMLRNTIHNKVNDRIKPSLCEANSLLNNYTFSGIPVDYIDIDPYGSPIPFIDSAVKPLAKHSYLGVTATDSGPLTCSHKAKTLRRYGVRCIDVDFDKELGLRILIYNLILRGASQDVSLEPVISYMHKYYYRVFFKAYRSGKRSYELLEECSGYIWYCKNTLERGYIREPQRNTTSTCSDGSRALLVGPLWICKLGDHEIIHKITVYMKEKFKDIISQETFKLLEVLREEININQPYIRYDLLFGYLKKNMPPIKAFIQFLSEHGVKASRSHFDPRAIKINISIRELMELLK